MDSLTLMRLLQVFDSQFPIGAYAYSGGLETYGQLGLDAAGLREVLETQIELGWGRLDLAALALAHRDADDAEALLALCEDVSAWKVVPTARESSLRLGTRMLNLAKRLFPEAADVTLSAAHHSVVVGVLARRMNMPLEAAMAAFAQSQLTASLWAATRSMPLGPGQAQGLLTALQPALEKAVGRVLENPEASLFAAAPALDIRAHQQTLLHTRLFQS